MPQHCTPYWNVHSEQTKTTSFDFLDEEFPPKALLGKRLLDTLNGEKYTFKRI
jgi:hypothetical protein